MKPEAGDRLWFTPKDNINNGCWLIVSKVGRRYYYFDDRPDIRGIIGLDGIISAHIDTHYMGSVWKSFEAYQRAKLAGGRRGRERRAAEAAGKGGVGEVLA